MGSISQSTMLDPNPHNPERPPSPSALSNLISTHPQSSSKTSLPLEILHNLQHQHRWTDLQLYSSSRNTTSSATSINNPGNISPISSISSRDPTPTGPSSSNPNDPLPLLPSPISSSQPSSPATPVPLLSGTPPTPLYTHPDLQLLLLKSPSHNQNQQPRKPEREFVLPTSLGRKWTLRELCKVFDWMPKRDPVRVRVRDRGKGEGGGNAGGKGKGGGMDDGDDWIEHQDAKRVLLAMKSQDGFGGDGTVVYYVMQEGEVKPRQN